MSSLSGLQDRSFLGDAFPVTPPRAPAVPPQTVVRESFQGRCDREHPFFRSSVAISRDVYRFSLRRSSNGSPPLDVLLARPRAFALSSPAWRDPYPFVGSKTYSPKLYPRSVLLRQRCALPFLREPLELSSKSPWRSSAAFIMPWSPSVDCLEVSRFSRSLFAFFSQNSRLPGRSTSEEDSLSCRG